MNVRGLGAPCATALVISECQNGMTNPDYATNGPLVEQITKRRTIENIAALAGALRPLGVAVVHVTVAAYPGFRGWSANCLLAAAVRKRALTIGEPATRIHPLLTPAAEDVLIERHRGLSCFHGTELEPLLRNLGVTSVILAGVSVDVAVTGSSLEAVNRGFTVVVPRDCVAGSSDEAYDFHISHTLRLLATVTDSAEIVTELAAAEPVA